MLSPGLRSALKFELLVIISPFGYLLRDSKKIIPVPLEVLFCPFKKGEMWRDVRSHSGI